MTKPWTSLGPVTKDFTFFEIHIMGKLPCVTQASPVWSNQRRESTPPEADGGVNLLEGHTFPLGRIDTIHHEDQVPEKEHTGGDGAWAIRIENTESQAGKNC